MRDDEVVQHVFGYDSGHRHLTGTSSISRESLRKLLPLSDLAAGVTLFGDESYVSGLPLSADEYAVLATWSDPLAGRPGCVLTHCLVARSSLLDDPTGTDRLLALLRRPSRASASFLSSGLDSRQVDAPSRPSAEALTACIAFLSHDADDPRYAPRLSAANALAAAGSIWGALWPELRKEFSFRTAVGRSARESEFSLSIRQEHSSGPAMSRPEPWMPLFSQQLILNGAQSREFLWRYGREGQQDLRQFRLLAELLVASVSDSRIDDELLMRVMADEGKRRLVTDLWWGHNRLHAGPTALLETALGPSARPASPEALQAQLTAAVGTEPVGLAHLLNRLTPRALQEATRHLATIRSLASNREFFENLSDGALLEVVIASPEARAWLFARNPGALAILRVWLACSNLTSKEIGSALLLEFEPQQIAQLVSQHPILVVATYERLGEQEQHERPAAAWLSYLRTAWDESLRLLVATSASAQCWAGAVELHGPQLTLESHERRVAIIKSASGAARTSTSLCVAVTLAAIVERDLAGLAIGLAPTYEQFASNSVSSGLRSMFESSLPSGWVSEWDLCRRLIAGVSELCIAENCTREQFDSLALGGQRVGAALVNELGNSSAGRRLLRRIGIR